MEKLERILSRTTAKPYRTRDLEACNDIHLDQDGLLEFGPDDIENPKNWSDARKSYITVVSNLLVLNAVFASSTPTGILDSLSRDLHVSTEASGLVISVYLLGYCAGPFVFAPLSEFFGRRYIFYISFTVYLAFTFLCAFAPNFGALLVGRFLTGTFASAPMTNSPGVLADIWGPLARGNALAIFAVISFVGPALGPVIAGFLELKEDWRWAFYILLWLGGFTEIIMFTIPETLPAIVLRNKAKRIRCQKISGFENVKAPVEVTDKSLAAMFKVALTRPWAILIDPISLLCAIYMAIVYMLLYMLFTIYPIVFQQKRRWNAGVGELPLLGTALGSALGGVIVVLNTRRTRKKEEAGRKAVPEDRLLPAMIGGILFPVTMFWFAWTAEYNSIHWMVPTLAGAFLGTSILLIFVGYINYLTDTYLMFAASALAANTLLRSAAGAAAPLFTSYMFEALGVGGGGSLVGGVAVLLAPIPFIFYKYGGPIRERSKFAPTPNKQPQPLAVERNASDETDKADAQNPTADSDKPEYS
ncbi:hypothetical protein ACEQ8H_004163 [Pleosporales sp. CAS-2024a]